MQNYIEVGASQVSGVVFGITTAALMLLIIISVLVIITLLMRTAKVGTVHSRVMSDSQGVQNISEDVTVSEHFSAATIDTEENVAYISVTKARQVSK